MDIPDYIGKSCEIAFASYEGGELHDEHIHAIVIDRLVHPVTKETVLQIDVEAAERSGYLSMKYLPISRICSIHWEDIVSCYETP